MLQGFDDFSKREVEIKHYLLENGVLVEDVDHVLNCCRSMAADRFGLYRAGSFIRAVLENDLARAAFAADDVNIKYLKQYLWFKMYWLPGGEE